MFKSSVSDAVRPMQKAGTALVGGPCLSLCLPAGGLGLLAGAWALAAGAALAAGCSPWALALVPLCAGLYLVGPGVFWYGALVRLGRLGAAGRRLAVPGILLTGTGFFAAVACVAFRFQNLWLLRVLPIPFAAAGVCGLAAALGRGGLRLEKRLGGAPWLLAAGLTALFALAFPALAAHPAAVGQTVIKQDFLWNVGNAKSFFLGFPPQDIRFSGVRLSYHYLNELLAAGLSAVSGADAYDILAFLWPPMVLAGAVAVTASLARQLFGANARRRTLALCLTFCSGSAALMGTLGQENLFYNNFLYHVLCNVNGVAGMVLYTGAWMSFVLAALAGRGRAWAMAALCGCATVMLCFAKGPAALVLALALLAAALWRTGCSLWNALRRGGRPGGMGRLWALALVCGGAAFAIYRVVFSAGANNMAFSPDATLMKGPLAGLLDAAGRVHPVLYWALVPAAALACLFLAAPGPAAMYAGALWRDVRRLGRLSAGRLLLHAGVAGGVLAFFLFDHSAMSQSYFLFLAMELMALLGAGAGRRPGGRAGLHRGRRWTRRAAAALCAAGFATAALDGAALAGEGLVRLGRNTGVLAKAEDMDVYPETEQAGRWLAEHMAPDEVFATNRYDDLHSAQGNSNLYTAFSGRQAFMEGYLYTVSNMGVSAETVALRFSQNAILFSPRADAQLVLDTARACGVDYLVFDTDYAYTGENGPQFALLELVLDTGRVQIYRVPGQAGAN